MELQLNQIRFDDDDASILPLTSLCSALLVQALCFVFICFEYAAAAPTCHVQVQVQVQVHP